MGNIAFYGGSFNPPTNVHLQIAKNVLNQLNIDKVYFVPVGNYYQKKGLIDVKHRFNMLKIICKNEENINVLDITLNQIKNLKAINIFKLLKEKFSNHNVYYIMGSDNFLKIDHWENFEELVKNYKLIIIKRDNININNLILQNKTLKDNKNNFIILNSEDTQYKIDSTEVRNKIKKQENVIEYIDENLINYIKENRLYLINNDDITYK